MSGAESSTLRISGIPPGLHNRDLEAAFGDFGPLRRCFAVRRGSKGADNDGADAIGYVDFVLSEDASRCLAASVVEVEHYGSKVKLTLEAATAKGKNPPVKEDLMQRRFDAKVAKKKRARVIVRNLSFKASEQELRNHFGGPEAVVEAKILLRPDGRRVGCAFVQFSTLTAAAKAIKALNGSEIKGRKVAVDWAVGKKEYQNDNESNEITENRESTDQGAELRSEQIQAQDDNKLDDDEDDDNDEDTQEGSGADAEEGSDEDVEEDSDDSQEEVESHKPMKGKTWHGRSTGHDVDQNLTVFLRNLSFDTSEEDLAASASEKFGPLIYAKLVINKETEMPKGTAFIKFKEVLSAEKCLEASGSETGIWIDKRRVYASMALTKEAADNESAKKKETKKEHKDSRNLHLAVEGLVRRGTQAAIGLSEADLVKREKVDKWKRAMLKNLNMFISPNRLCFRNLPPHIGDKSLRKLALKHLKDQGKDVRISEAKVIRDLNLDQSKGYGFVTLGKHEHALTLLRKLNNNPEVFTKNSRPIVEFSVENRKAVNARKRRLEKSQDLNPLFKKDKSASNKVSHPYERKSEKELPSDRPEFLGSVHNPKSRQLPSHVGEKMRHNRPKITRKDIKKNFKRKKEEKIRVQEGPPAKKQKPKDPKKKQNKEKVLDLREEKQFSEMVAKYKSKLSSPDQVVTKKAKWFDP